eukprot:m.346806 g.346806  ORF g.346806 m.346806 type:complete len:668 (+) comp30399_c0_seq1:136-2139(+)
MMRLFLMFVLASILQQGYQQHPDDYGILPGVQIEFPDTDGPTLAFYSTAGLPAACVNNPVYPETMCDESTGLNPSTGKDRVLGKWPYLVRGVRDVAGLTGLKFENSTTLAKATLALTIADVLSDRLAIATKGAVNVTLSAQQLIDCADWGRWSDSNPVNKDGFSIGSLLQYTVDIGLVPDVCYSYNLSTSAQKCGVQNALNGTLCPSGSLVCNSSALRNGSRIDCNISDPWRCELSGCCFDRSQAPTSPRCFRPWLGPNPTPPQETCTAISIDKRVDCGYVGIGQYDCEQQGCCYDNKTLGTYYCFHPTIPVLPIRIPQEATFYKAKSWLSFPDPSGQAEANPMAELMLNGPIISPRLDIRVGGYNYAPGPVGPTRWPVGIRNYCEGYVCTGEDASCQEYAYITTGCKTAPLGGDFVNQTSFWSKIVGYSSGCDKYGWNDCHSGSCTQCYYHIHQSYFGTEWGVNGYFRGWTTHYNPVKWPKVSTSSPSLGYTPCETGFEPQCVYWVLYVEDQQPPKPGPGRKTQYKKLLKRHDPFPETIVPSVYNNTCPPSPTSWTQSSGTICQNILPVSLKNNPNQIQCCDNKYGMASCTDVSYPVCCSGTLSGAGPYYCPQNDSDAPYGYMCCANWTKYDKEPTAIGCAVKCKPGTKTPGSSCYIEGQSCPPVN